MTGGYNGHAVDYSSTEEFIKGGTSWTLTENSLPTRMYALRIISYNNQVFVTGKQNHLEQNINHVLNQLLIPFSGGYERDTALNRDEILLYDEVTKTFKQTGKLETGRRYHSMSVVDTSDFNCS